MSLWNKPVEAITFEDIDAFLRQRHKEGPRLDYKADLPKELAKLVAAFANTNGGTIVLGVAADTKTNEPVWPSAPGSPGLKSEAGIEERIVAICQDNMHPPLVPQVSRVINNPHLPGHVLVVVRVDESPEAPHSVNGGRHIYERTGSQGKPYDFAHIDRIAHLLRRRQRIEGEREAIIERAIDRASHQLVGRQVHYIQPPGLFGPGTDGGYWMLVPLRWASVIPFYPWRDLCRAEDCFGRHQFWPHFPRVQRAPGGSYAIMGPALGSEKGRGRSALTTKGHVFAIEWASEAENHYRESQEPGQAHRAPSDFWLSFDMTSRFLLQVLRGAAGFYGSGMDLPGHLLVSMGFLDVRHYRMHRERCEGESRDFRGERFPDATFRVDVPTHVADFLMAPNAVASDFLDHLACGFDLPAPPR
jgi:hypothetical protein